MGANNREESELITVTRPSVNGENCVDTIVCASKAESLRITELFKNGDWKDEFIVVVDGSILTYKET